ncbi:hypothetical protein ACOSQ3_018669 [Xanthoceras sorbifolium]
MDEALRCDPGISMEMELIAHPISSWDMRERNKPKIERGQGAFQTRFCNSRSESSLFVSLNERLNLIGEEVERVRRVVTTSLEARGAPSFYCDKTLLGCAFSAFQVFSEVYHCAYREKRKALAVDLDSMPNQAKLTLTKVTRTAVPLSFVPPTFEVD